MKKNYTRKQIVEAIAYWKKQLAKGNYRKVSESLPANTLSGEELRKKLGIPSKDEWADLLGTKPKDAGTSFNIGGTPVKESSVGDFFGKIFKTKKFLDKQNELLKQKNYKEHPLMQVADKMNDDPNNRRFYVRFTNVDIENDGYPIDVSATLDCIAIRLNRDGSDRYDNIGDDEDEIMELAKACGLPDGYKFYQVNDIAVIANISKGYGITKVNEADDEFEKIDDIAKYLADKKDLKWIKVYKFQRIEAKQSDGGEEVQTIGSDNNEETKRTTKKGDWIVNNVSNKDNKWIIDDKTFKKKYEEDKDGVYKPKGGEMLAAKVADCAEGGVEFAPPNWGGDVIKIKNDGWFMKDPSNEKDIYAISKKDFDSTYKPVGK